VPGSARSLQPAYGMLVITPLALVVCLLGLVVYLLPITNGKVTEAGRLAFACGLLVVLLIAGGHGVLKLG
jgi:hypothetical protein